MLSRNKNMEKKEVTTCMQKQNRSSNGWIIIFLIIFTLCTFLWAMVYTVEQENNRTYKCAEQEKITTEKTPTSLPLFTSTPPPNPVKILRNEKILNRYEKMDVINDAMKRHFHSLPNTIDLMEDKRPTHNVYSIRDLNLSLHGYEISSFSIGKSFYIYDCTIVPVANNQLMTTILMELPEINIVFKDHPEYSKYYPTINPYIHVVELVYFWEYDKDTLETKNQMILSNIRIVMVSWENNLYRKSYEQVKNSPLYKANVPIPLNLKKEELYDFLTRGGVLDQIPMIFNPPITLQPIHKNTSV